MNTQAFEQFDVMDKEALSTVEGGGKGSCLSSAAAAIGASTLPGAAMYLGAQAFAAGANYYYCTH